MTFVAIAIGGSALIGAGVALYEGGKQGQVANSELAIESDQENRQDTMFGSLMNLINNPGSFFGTSGSSKGTVDTTSLGGAALNQGGQQVARQMAAGGFLGSGNEATALQAYGQTMGFNEYTTQEQILESGSGLNVNPASAGSAASSALSAQGNSLNSLAGILSFLGTSKGGAGAGGGGAATSVTGSGNIGTMWS